MGPVAETYAYPKGTDVLGLMFFLSFVCIL